MVTKQTLNDLDTNCIHIWQINLDGPIDVLVELLSNEELIRAEAKIESREQNRTIRARGCMRSILGDYLEVPGNELLFTQGEKGKPSIYQPNSTIEFNLTHCEDMALLAVAKATPVGIDLERIRKKPHYLKIAQRVFPESICTELEQLPANKLDRKFFHYWTKLESSVKCAGNGIFSPENNHNDTSTTHFSPQDGWIACIAAKDRDITTLELKHFVYMY